MSPAPWDLINTAAFVCVVVVILLAMPHKLNSSLEALSHEFIFTLNTELSTFIELIVFFIEIMTTGFECQRTILHSLGNILHTYRSMKDVLRSTSTLRFSALPNKARGRSLPVRIINGTMSSTLTALCLAICNFGNSTDSMDSFQSCGRTSLVIEL